MTNAIKHAFPEQRRGTLRITLRREGPDELLLGVADDGIGMPGDYANNVRGSLGWRLVKAFADQLGAYIRVGTEHGTNVEMVFRPEG
jgi:two-component sensor histidine kinase